MNPVDFCLRILSGRDGNGERVVMARIALNALVDPHAYPVDLSELAALSCEPNILTRSMLTYCAMHPEEFGSLGERLTRRLSDFVQESVDRRLSRRSVHEGNEQ